MLYSGTFFKMIDSKIYTPYEQFDGRKPLFFLAGPVMGARNWQDEAIGIIRRQNLGVVIACPKQPQFHEVRFSLEEQTDWESYHLQKASEKGVILFWLAREENHICQRAYAQTTRFELGEWNAKQKGNPIFLAVGIEDGFTNGNYIKRRIKQDNPKIKICETLEETCEVALKIIESRKI